MSVFKTLLEMATQSDFTIGVRAIGQDKSQLSLILCPVAKEGQEPALSQPVRLSGTVQELEEKFCPELARVIGARASLAEQVDATLAILDAAKNAQASKATASLKGKSKSQDADKVVDEKGTEADSLSAGETAGPGQTTETAPALEPANLFANLT